MESLRHCPFCGGKPIWQLSSGGQAANFSDLHRINCSECYRVDMPYWSDKIDCIKQWNARAPSEQLAMHYQPIDTAPKDGTEVIGIYLRPADEWSSAFVYGPWTMAWDHRKSRWCSSWDGWEVVKYMSDFGTEYKELDMQPTHWSPFPTFAKPEEPPT